MAASAGRRHNPSMDLDTENVNSNSGMEHQTSGTVSRDDDIFHDSYENEVDSNENEVVLSADATELSTNELLMKIYKESREMRQDMKELTAKVDFALGEIAHCKKDVENMKKETKCMSVELQTARNEIVSLKNENELLHNRITQLDSYGRRSNLIFYGLTQKPNENCSDTVKTVLKTKLGIENVEAMRFERCHRTPAPIDPKPVIVRFNWYQDRDSVWKARKKLQGTKISLSEDFPREIADRRKTLFPILKKAKELGKNAFMVADKLHIDGSVYTVSNLHTLPPNLDPAHLATKRIGNVTAFFSKSSPLSNFFEANVKIENENFVTVEQYFQYRKALFAEKPDIAWRIKNTKSPGLCKKLGDSIKLDDASWLPTAKETLSRACAAKFKQNIRARNFLLNTEKTVLAEASKDRYWGIGASLNSEGIDDMSKWGSNVFGDILMSVRQRIQSEITS